MDGYTDECMDGWMDGWMDTCRWTDRWMDIDVYMYEKLMTVSCFDHGWMYGRKNRWTAGWLNGWMDR